MQNNQSQSSKLVLGAAYNFEYSKNFIFKNNDDDFNDVAFKKRSKEKENFEKFIRQLPTTSGIHILMATKADNTQKTIYIIRALENSRLEFNAPLILNEVQIQRKDWLNKIIIENNYKKITIYPARYEKAKTD